jgi:hypothetical protein
MGEKLRAKESIKVLARRASQTVLLTDAIEILTHIRPLLYSADKILIYYALVTLAGLMENGLDANDALEEVEHCAELLRHPGLNENLACYCLMVMQKAQYDYIEPDKVGKLIESCIALCGSENALLVQYALQCMVEYIKQEIEPTKSDAIADKCKELLSHADEGVLKHTLACVRELPISSMKTCEASLAKLLEHQNVVIRMRAHDVLAKCTGSRSVLHFIGKNELMVANIPPIDDLELLKSVVPVVVCKKAPTAVVGEKRKGVTIPPPEPKRNATGESTPLYKNSKPKKTVRFAGDLPEKT